MSDDLLFLLLLLVCGVVVFVGIVLCDDGPRPGCGHNRD